MPTERFKSQKCKVLRYDMETNELDVDFLGYGMRLYNTPNINDRYVTIRYLGEIGNPNFVYKL